MQNNKTANFHHHPFLDDSSYLATILKGGINFAVICTIFLAPSSLVANPPGTQVPEVPADIVRKTGCFLTLADKVSGDILAPSAPGKGIKGVTLQKAGSLRIPFFLIWAGNELSDKWGSPPFLQECREQIISQQPSLRSFMTTLYGEQMQFFREEDIFPVRLPGTMEQYISEMGHPKRLLLTDLQAYINGTKMSDNKMGTGIMRDFSVFDNDFIEGDAEGIIQGDGTILGDDEEIDMAVLMFVTGKHRLYALRSWTETTAKEGYDFANVSGSSSKEAPLDIKGIAGSPKMKLSSYCIGRLFESPEATDKIRGFGWLAHELLHCFGLPDLYDTDTEADKASGGEMSGGCGSACCMSWGMVGLVPGEKQLTKWEKQIPLLPGAWCRFFLGVNRSASVDWPFTPPSVTIQRTIKLKPATSNVGAFARIWLEPQDGYDHYLMIEWRRAGMNPPDTYDWDMVFGEKGGFLIWEVDESVGRFCDKSKTNPFWPMCYMGEKTRYKPGRMNDSESQPMVWLHASEVFPKASRNFRSDTLWKPSCLWTSNSGVFKQDNIILSAFDEDQGTFKAVMTVNSSAPSAPGAPAEPVSTTIPVTSAPSPPTNVEPATKIVIVEQPDQGTKGPDFMELNGEGSKLINEVSPHLKEQLRGVFKSYPRFEAFDYLEEAGGKVRLSMPVPHNASKFKNDVNSQIQALGVKATETNANGGACIARIEDGELEKFAACKTATLTKPLFTQLNDKIVRVRGGEITLTRQDGDTGTVRYEFDPKVPVRDKLEECITREEFVQNIEGRFKVFLEKARKAGRIPRWEMIADKSNGSLVWLCQTPASNGKGVVIIEMDAKRPPGGLTDETPVTIK